MSGYLSARWQSGILFYDLAGSVRPTHAGSGVRQMLKIRAEIPLFWNSHPPAATAELEISTSSTTICGDDPSPMSNQVMSISHSCGTAPGAHTSRGYPAAAN